MLSKTRLLFTSTLITGFVLVAAAIIIAWTSGDVTTSTDTILAQQIAQSANECVVCHTNHTPGIVNQYGASAHFANNVSCEDCHEVEAEYPGAVQHPDEDFWVLPYSSTAQCETCHREQVQQFYLSRHALPAYVAYAGSGVLNEEHLEIYRSIPEGGGYMDRSRNSLHAMEGEAVTRFACETCHDVGKPNPDNSIGNCTACHIRHEFSLEQARKPETCNACHIGPDHPQWEIYQQSAHGILYMTDGHNWHWDAEPGTLTTVDMPAPTCSTCHMSGFGLSATTHDVGDRLSWFLAAPISTRRPSHLENIARMQGVCLACHSNNFVDTFYADADALVESVNDWVRASDLIMATLRENDLVTAAPFDEPIDYTHFNLWHHWGRTAKFGAWMQGADYVQWHGAYEILHEMAELAEEANDRLEEAGLEPIEFPEGFPGIDAAREFIAEAENAE
ncbi:MAG: nitrate reductase [Phototrophicales bacterium]|nr:MAG: nitrate reductase [Phototrophicales bacterium]RMG72618.1 MAG: nitrate reductase [Chloroflexota bacterium]